MALLPAYYTTTNLSSRKKSKKSAKDIQQELEHQKFLKRMGVKGFDGKRTAEIPSYKVENSVPLSNSIPGGTFKKKDLYSMTKNESKEVAEEIRRKANRVAPAYNKGATQYITPGTDLSDLGRKK
jgi:hypothetical protein